MQSHHHQISQCLPTSEHTMIQFRRLHHGTMRMILFPDRPSEHIMIQIRCLHQVTMTMILFPDLPYQHITLALNLRKIQPYLGRCLKSQRNKKPTITSSHPSMWSHHTTIQELQTTNRWISQEFLVLCVTYLVCCFSVMCRSICKAFLCRVWLLFYIMSVISLSSVLWSLY